MPPRPRTFGWDITLRSLRFLYLLWGGMLLSTLAIYGRLRIPSGLWQWPWLAKGLMGPVGRGFALGLGLVMLIAALVEIWEIVDRLLARFLGDP